MRLNVIDRWGFEIKNKQYLTDQDIKSLNMPKYIDNLKKAVAAKKVYVVDCRMRWIESPLMDWFKDNYSMFGFSEIYCQADEIYKRCKREQKFYGYPDFLGLKDGKISRVEIECFPCGYKHSEDYCEIVLCYELNQDVSGRPQQWFGLKELLGYEDIINVSEILDYLYLKDSTFRGALKRSIRAEMAKMLY